MLPPAAGHRGFWCQVVGQQVLRAPAICWNLKISSCAEDLKIKHWELQLTEKDNTQKEILCPECSEEEKEHTEESKSKENSGGWQETGRRWVSVSTDACSYRHRENRFMDAYTTECSKDGILHTC